MGLPGSAGGPDGDVDGGEGRAVGAALAHAGVIRTRFFDEHLVAACASGCRQVVLLGAGLDTRGFRLVWPHGVRLWELDREDVLGFKQEVLDGVGATPACARTALPVDLREDWATALVESGFHREQPTAWLAEGLLLYLDAEQAQQLLLTVTHLSATGSQLALEATPKTATAVLARFGRLPAATALAASWRGGLGEDPATWLNRHGWRATARDLDEVAAGYERLQAARSTGYLITAVHSTLP